MPAQVCVSLVVFVAHLVVIGVRQTKGFWQRLRNRSRLSH
jgi:hypothetical protein